MPGTVRVIVWPDGVYCDYEDFKPHEWGHKSDDYSIVELSESEYEEFRESGILHPRSNYE